MAQTTEKMQVIAIARFGKLDELKLYDLPKPKPAADEVLIRVRAAGVGIWDSEQREGALAGKNTTFPLILGGECAGDIERVGADVKGLANTTPCTRTFLENGAPTRNTSPSRPNMWRESRRRFPIKVHVFKDFPLADARGAQQAAAERHGPGEIVLSVN